jgi:hypothetical protein
MKHEDISFPIRKQENSALLKFLKMVCIRARALAVPKVVEIVLGLSPSKGDGA